MLRANVQSATVTTPSLYSPAPRGDDAVLSDTVERVSVSAPLLLMAVVACVAVTLERPTVTPESIVKAPLRPPASSVTPAAGPVIVVAGPVLDSSSTVPFIVIVRAEPNTAASNVIVVGDVAALAVAIASRKLTVLLPAGNSASAVVLTTTVLISVRRSSNSTGARAPRRVDRGRRMCRSLRQTGRDRGRRA